MNPRARTLAQKVWDDHVVASLGPDTDLLYIDLHLTHEVTSPQAFDALRLRERKVRRTELTLATEDHNVPTAHIERPVQDPLSRDQIQALRRNSREFGVLNLPIGSRGQGIVHVIGPERGLTQPGATIVCGDSHTSTHGAFGALAFGIGTSEVEHVLATQTIPQRRPKQMAVTIDGTLGPDVTSKDVILTLISRVGTGGGQGHVVEYRGSAVRAMSMESRMTLCNMSVEWGARAGMVAPDDTTFDYLRGRPNAPSGNDWDDAVEYWRTLTSDDDAHFDERIAIDARDVRPFVTWGTTPAQGVPIDGLVPDPTDFADERERAAAESALAYMGLTPNTPMRQIEVDSVFVGSCTNGRIEDLRAAASVLRGRKVAGGVRLLVVPGSMRVREEAEAEGLHDVFLAAGGEWRTAGCSLCLGMNEDRLANGERCASTSNRNFQGRQGPGGRTHLVSPLVAAASAVAGRIAAPSDLSSPLGVS